MDSHLRLLSVGCALFLLGHYVSAEGDVQEAVVKLLRTAGWDVTITSVDRRTRIQTRGLPDLYCRHPGKQERMWVECKAPGKEPSATQAVWIGVERRCGGRVLVVDSLDSLEEQLR